MIIEEDKMASIDGELEGEVAEDEPLYIPPEFRNLKAERRSWSVRELWRAYMDGKLNLQAEFQREYVWDDGRASRFIESLLLGLPVPPVFLAENDDGTWDVVDGHQRLDSLFGFLQPLAAGPSQSAQVRPNFSGVETEEPRRPSPRSWRFGRNRPANAGPTGAAPARN